MNGSRIYILICLGAMILLGGCEAKTRYQVLSFFFDGVPAPREEAQLTTPSGGTDEKQAVQQERSSKHGPYAAKMCSACHDPSTNALLLPREKLCLKCHVIEAGRKQHGPVASGGCLVCHDPHRSSNAYLLVSPAKEFCTYCHDPNEIYARPAHQGVSASCTECHNPHGSDNDYFLR